ncbi:hypothetical protein AcW1_000021 [Taiwanofungus camphoratus]|nr:hypothetical protein AcW2_001484 [Antrodia cinnamomea]KAI0962730.1 hypothetical protein AcW1_000021 [Antrodia cinnamomea]
MSTAADTFKPALPTLDKLGASLQPDLDVQKVASEWFRAFSQYISANDIDGILGISLEDVWWRDMLALTWEFRTFHGAPKVKTFLQDRLTAANVSSLELGDVALKQPYPDLAWIQSFFTFETDVGIASGVFRLVPSSTGIWKAFTIYTNLEDLKGFPEKIGPHRNFLPNHGKWKSQREREREFVDADPKVIVVGGGQSGLDVAARLKFLDVPTLVVEKNNRIGDQWRGRYEALCLHDPVYYDHRPYLPFPPSWPVFTPALKFADWLEYYAEALEINVWTSSVVTRAEQVKDNKWIVVVQRADGTERKLHVDHVILALGLGAGTPNMPSFPGREEYQGQVLHSTEHKSARNHVGKKVLIIGSSTSAHDVAADCVEHGVDVTMYQREPTYIMSTKEGSPRLFKDLYWEGGPPIDVADRVHASMPMLLAKLIQQRVTAEIAEADKKTLDGLRKVGFKLYFGDEGSGFFILSSTRGGGYYLDVGTSQLIIDGKIKLKNDSKIERFTKTGIKFDDGSEIDADVVLFATGFDSPHSAIKRLVGEEVGSRVSPIWNLTPEGEQRGAWSYLGVPNLWFMMGNLAMCRFYSKHLALQIKAIQEGVYGSPYRP